MNRHEPHADANRRSARVKGDRVSYKPIRAWTVFEKAQASLWPATKEEA